MNARDFSLAYIDTTLETLQVSYDGNPSDDTLSRMDGEWSRQTERRLQRRVQELFFYETQAAVESLRAQRSFSKNRRGFSVRRAVHFGLIGETSDPLEVVGQALLFSDVVVFQDLLYRTIVGGNAVPAEPRRTQILDLAFHLVRMRPLVERNALVMIPWLPQWDPLFAKTLLGSTGPLEPDKETDFVVANGLCLSLALDGIPFTTWDEALARLQTFAVEFRGTGPTSAAERRQARRVVDCLKFLEGDRELAFLSHASPRMILDVAQRYDGFKGELYEVFDRVRECEDDSKVEEIIERELKTLRTEVRKARRDLRRDAVKMSIGGLVAGLGSASVFLDATSQQLLGFGLGAATGAAAMKAVAPIVKWIESRIGTVPEQRPLIEGLIRLQRSAGPSGQKRAEGSNEGC